jgi:hypothetical protein
VGLGAIALLASRWRGPARATLPVATHSEAAQSEDGDTMQKRLDEELARFDQ